MTITFPKRFDENEAKKGVWFDVYDEHDNFYGSYLCRLYDNHNPITKMLVEKYNRVHRKALSGKEVSEDERGAHFLVHTILMDWKLKDDAGKAVAYSPEKAVEVLGTSDAQFVVEFLFKCAKNTANFRGADDAEAAQGEVAKN